MIELQVEAFFEAAGKSLSRRLVTVHVRVADKAHGRVGRAELCSVASEAILVTGEAGLRGVVISMMTSRTRDRRMTLTRVQKLRVVQIVTLGQSEGKRKK
jgi:hypothetical protein